MTTTSDTRTTPRDWVDRWDRQQEVYVPFREQRFQVVLDTIDHLIVRTGGNPAFRVLDLACGPGALAERLLPRFPQAHYVGADVDVVLLHLGRAVTAPFGDRCDIRTVDLALEDWPAQVGDKPFDVITSSTALHWLKPAELAMVLSHAYRLLRPGGLFLNADNLRFPDHSPLLNELATAVNAQGPGLTGPPAEAETWAQWWEAVRVDPELAPLRAQRDQRLAPTSDEEAPPPLLDLYLGVLAGVGFRDATTIWQWFDDRVLFARKPTTS